MQLDGSRFLLRICRALNLNRRESIDDLSRICQRLKDGLNGSKIYRESIQQTESTRILFNGSRKLSRSYGEIIQKSWWIEKLLRILSRPEKESSIERNLSKMCGKAVKLKERRFFKKGKTHRDKCNKQATQTNIQAT